MENKGNEVCPFYFIESYAKKHKETLFMFWCSKVDMALARAVHVHSDHMMIMAENFDRNSINSLPQPAKCDTLFIGESDIKQSYECITLGTELVSMVQDNMVFKTFSMFKDAFRTSAETLNKKLLHVVTYETSLFQSTMENKGNEGCPFYFIESYAKKHKETLFMFWCSKVDMALARTVHVHSDHMMIMAENFDRNSINSLPQPAKCDTLFIGESDIKQSYECITLGTELVSMVQDNMVFKTFSMFEDAFRTSAQTFNKKLINVVTYGTAGNSSGPWSTAFYLANPYSMFDKDLKIVPRPPCPKECPCEFK